MGAGALGHIGAQLSKALGLFVSVLDSRDAPLELCRSLSPWAPDLALNTSSVSASSPSSVKALVEHFGEAGEPHAVLVSTDVAPAFELALALARRHGQVQVVGQPREPIPVPYFPLIFRDVKVTGSLLGDQDGLKKLVDFVQEKGVEVRTRAYGLEEVPRLLADYGKEGHAGKLVVRVGAEE